MSESRALQTQGSRRDGRTGRSHSKDCIGYLEDPDTFDRTSAMFEARFLERSQRSTVAALALAVPMTRRSAAGFFRPSENVTLVSHPITYQQRGEATEVAIRPAGRVADQSNTDNHQWPPGHNSIQDASPHHQQSGPVALTSAAQLSDGRERRPVLSPQDATTRGGMNRESSEHAWSNDGGMFDTGVYDPSVCSDHAPRVQPVCFEVLPMLVGRIRRWQPADAEEPAWGFVMSDLHGADLFLDSENCDADVNLSEGDLVKFELCQGEDGLTAARKAIQITPEELHEMLVELEPVYDKYHQQRHAQPLEDISGFSKGMGYEPDLGHSPPATPFQGAQGVPVVQGAPGVQGFQGVQGVQRGPAVLSPGGHGC